MLSVLCWCLSALAAEPVPPAPAVASITRITLERNCFGCPTASVLTLSRDGTAMSTQTGNARLGTADIVSRGAMRAGDFDQLAQQIVAHGFFGLADVYEDPQLQDGPSTMTSVGHGGQIKRVFRRDDAGPAALKALESAIESFAARIRFVAERP